MEYVNELFPHTWGVPIDKSSSVGLATLPHTRGGVPIDTWLYSATITLPHTRGVSLVVGSEIIPYVLFPTHVGCPLYTLTSWLPIFLFTHVGVSLRIDMPKSACPSSPHTWGVLFGFSEELDFHLPHTWGVP